ncbi:MAG: DUF1924 domain-containing protein [Burkholderiaceae bacterium]|jgi:hypothetical protein|nr:DUF1924 domain-containing protein [Burkholderiaceae bacterium]
MRRLIPFAAGALLATGAAFAQPPADTLRGLEQAARSEGTAFAGFSALRGAAFFRAQHASDWTCTSCHTADPRGVGKHAVTGKAIEPLAPTVNAARLSDPARTEKWFRRNCNDVLKRECSAQEKGDVVAYLISLAP